MTKKIPISASLNSYDWFILQMDSKCYDFGNIQLIPTHHHPSGTFSKATRLSKVLMLGVQVSLRLGKDLLFLSTTHLTYQKLHLKLKVLSLTKMNPLDSSLFRSMKRLLSKPNFFMVSFFLFLYSQFNTRIKRKLPADIDFFSFLNF